MVRKQVFQKHITPSKIRKSPIVHAPGLTIPERKVRPPKPTIDSKPNIKVKKVGEAKLKKMVRQLTAGVEDKIEEARNKNCWFVGPLPARSLLDRKTRYQLHKVFTEHIKLPSLPCTVHKREQAVIPTTGYTKIGETLIGRIDVEGEDLILTLEEGMQSFHGYDRYIHPSDFYYRSI